MFFSLHQRNNLLTGKELASEIEGNIQVRTFIVIGSYMVDKTGKKSKTSHFMKSEVPTNMCFWLKKYDIEREFIDSWYADMHLSNIISIDGIVGFDQLEELLLPYTSDFAAFDVSWKRDNPL